MPIRMKHVSMMHARVMHVKNWDGRTNERTSGKLNSKSFNLLGAGPDGILVPDRLVFSDLSNPESSKLSGIG